MLLSIKMIDDFNTRLPLLFSGGALRAPGSNTPRMVTGWELAGLCGSAAHSHLPHGLHKATQVAQSYMCTRELTV